VTANNHLVANVLENTIRNIRNSDVQATSTTDGGRHASAAAHQPTLSQTLQQQQQPQLPTQDRANAKREREQETGERQVIESHAHQHTARQEDAIMRAEQQEDWDDVMREAEQQDRDFHERQHREQAVSQNYSAYQELALPPRLSNDIAISNPPRNEHINRQDIQPRFHSASAYYPQPREANYNNPQGYNNNGMHLQSVGQAQKPTTNQLGVCVNAMQQDLNNRAKTSDNFLGLAPGPSMSEFTPLPTPNTVRQPLADTSVNEVESITPIIPGVGHNPSDQAPNGQEDLMKIPVVLTASGWQCPLCPKVGACKNADLARSYLRKHLLRARVHAGKIFVCERKNCAMYCSEQGLQGHTHETA
jgi:hypothetical protein